MNLINCIIVLIQTTCTIATAPSVDIVFIIQSQDTKYQNELSQKLKGNIIQQSIELQPNFTIKVHLLNEIFNYPGGWTIHNLIPQLMLLKRKHYTDTNTNNDQDDMKVINDNTRWIVFCEEKTKVNVKLLLENLNYENHTQPLYLGHSLYDREPTIIHHFAFFENTKWFSYPMLRAGVVFSMPLLKSIAEIYANHNNKHFKQQQFSIDAGHELALFIYDNIHLTALPLKTQQIHENNNQHVNIYHHHTSFDKTANKQDNNKQTLNKLKHTTTFNVSCDVSHTDFPTTNTNKINIDKHRNEISNPTGGNTSSTSFKKKQKIILKKASYICPEASLGEMIKGSNSNNMNKKNNINSAESCAMYAEPTINVASITCSPVKPTEIYFAVKTCSKYHNERLPIIQTTWAACTKHIKYFSDIQDATIPTTNTGVPNVEMGHCSKTLQILKQAQKDIEKYNRQQQIQKQYKIKWLFLTDDDTILSVSGVCQVLGCYNSMDEIYLGERYGYRLYDQDGFNYITGGGGIAFSLPVVKLILQYCSCPSPTAPDDMILGSCLHSLQLKALHSSQFHQARPNDYPWELLKQEPPISFHKFWQLDPVDVYNRWFAAQDQQLVSKENLMCQDTIDENYPFKQGKDFAKTEFLSLNKMPVAMMTTLHHTKERHVDL